MKEKIANTFRVVILSLILSTAIGYSLAAWQAPPGPPPAGNPPPAINAGASPQLKDGNLWLNNYLIAPWGSFPGKVKIGDPSPTILPADPALKVLGNARFDNAGAGRIFMGGSNSNFFGNATDLAARQTGAFRVQTPAGAPGALVSGTGQFSGKVTSASTVAGDIPTTLTTKDYVDGQSDFKIHYFYKDKVCNSGTLSGGYYVVNYAAKVPATASAVIVTALVPPGEIVGASVRLKESAPADIDDMIFATSNASMAGTDSNTLFLPTTSARTFYVYRTGSSSYCLEGYID